jgi:hypothetical protein
VRWRKHTPPATNAARAATAITRTSAGTAKLRLRDYKRGALIEEPSSGSWHDPTTGSSGSRYWIHITGAGWVLYERELGPLP